MQAVAHKAAARGVGMRLGAMRVVSQERLERMEGTQQAQALGRDMRTKLGDLQVRLRFHAKGMGLGFQQRC
jgi:hypothetical protein